ncbi:MAG: UTP--glucose-1-phosphate uridylyltransferase [Deltaproteobacteria bacterium GWA2_38_16]|nr:MAG: UTP--glucose-1-phosphate uridylyltransferase [Deltaproteobacteria bacterium GWA2_38_16]OGQ01736.1 MAG: UTP--glucose-1-phosphate uridylyltransferase [Deltaproteobacteria bacterium RIFCSPHIGHO2_02_FULL_38_15]OGQ34809.1 MAG: UTP--glucose-1-phosphate uridylyltransferase [Deltaproteobacteria bacterium RIFCSPLOWO2_01_FULL_38_9]OGQ62232.1 MAG: UTP--glucose-1-phosphate uridylyltransferase [Deltaproteobacteria bacterium RIFCSPLOWO2_12_FULL_38_8]HBQ21461.1 UTP--glucose-1-phosphate uridylyltransfe
MKIRKAVIPVAGLGTRFLPATKTIPKEMLPIVDKPSIQYIVEEAVQSGIEQIIFINARGKEAIEDHFDTHIEMETILKNRGNDLLLEEIQKLSRLVQIATIRQKVPLGLGHAILCAKDLVGQEPFAVMLGDDLVDSKVPCIQQLIHIFNEEKASVIALMKVKKEQTSLYGIADATPRKSHERLHDIRALLEKPPVEKAPSNLAIIGRYILTPEIFDQLEEVPPGKGGEIQLTDALVKLLHFQKVLGYCYEGERFDAGDKFGFLEANLHYAFKRPEFKERLYEKISSLYHQLLLSNRL